MISWMDLRPISSCCFGFNLYALNVRNHGMAGCPVEPTLKRSSDDIKLLRKLINCGFFPVIFFSILLCQPHGFVLMVPQSMKSYKGRLHFGGGLLRRQPMAYIAVHTISAV
jgi:hypothetical protein